LQAAYFTALFLVLLSRVSTFAALGYQNIDIQNIGCTLYIGIYLPAWQLQLESAVSRFTSSRRPTSLFAKCCFCSEERNSSTLEYVFHLTPSRAEKASQCPNFLTSPTPPKQMPSS